MAKVKREQILFSCLGFTDPVRGCHDGAMLHIARHYRPSKIFWYITKETHGYELQDDRFRQSIEKLKEQCPGYEPEILEPYYDQRDDASDFDGFYEPFYEQLKKLSSLYPEAEILVNLSSGTPQMQMTLAILCESFKFRIKGIQVKNFERRSGTSPRTNNKDYDVSSALRMNKDAEEGSENRCSEPKLIVIQREKLYSQVETLLCRYDYDAVLSFKTLPDRLTNIIEHLALRAAYDVKAAEEKAKTIKMELYPASNKKEETYPEYRDISEYILCLKLMQRTGRYTDLVIRLNPLVIRLQKAWLDKKGMDFESISYIDRRKRLIIDRERLRRNNPELFSFIDGKFKHRFSNSPLNIILCNYFIEWIGEDKSPEGELFKKFEILNESRNDSAHKLQNTGEEDVKRAMGFGSRELIDKLVQLCAEIYPQHYKEELFSIYDELNRHILAELR